MAKLTPSGLYMCSKCERYGLSRDDFFHDSSKKYELSNLCRKCEGERTKQAKHDHYMRSSKRKAVAAKRSKRAYYVRNKEDIMAKSRVYKRRNPGKIRAYLLKRRYKLTPEERQEMIDEQQGCCDICGVFQGDKLKVDHDHRTGMVRAMLCHNCNTGLGFLQDDIEILAVAHAYLIYYSPELSEI